MSRIFLWVTSNMDGACSTILLKNVFKRVEYESVFFGKFVEDYKYWKKFEIDDYDKIFIVGMIPTQKTFDLIDDKRVIFITNHDCSELIYDDMKVVCDDGTSLTKIIYDKFKNKHEFSKELKYLTLYATDYMSYKLKYKESEYLNGFYRTLYLDRFRKFVNRFEIGYDGFTKNEIAKIEDYYYVIGIEYKNLELFEGDFMGVSVLAAFTEKSVNEIAAKIMKDHECDVVMIMNPQTKYVSFRKHKNAKESASAGEMAHYLCKGGGNKQTAGGKITQQFLNFSKTLKQLKP